MREKKTGLESVMGSVLSFFFFQAEDGIRDRDVTEFRRVLFDLIVLLASGHLLGSGANDEHLEVHCLVGEGEAEVVDVVVGVVGGQQGEWVFLVFPFLVVDHAGRSLLLTTLVKESVEALVSRLHHFTVVFLPDDGLVSTGVQVDLSIALDVDLLDIASASGHRVHGVVSQDSVPSASVGDRKRSCRERV